MPSEIVTTLDRLPPYNRTAHINQAVRTYLEVQGKPVNRYGVDCRYFKERMGRLMRDMDNYTPMELVREFSSMADTAGAVYESV